MQYVHRRLVSIQKLYHRLMLSRFNCHGPWLIVSIEKMMLYCLLLRITLPHRH